jgi:hypothetical protein
VAVAGLLGSLPEWLDLDFARTSAGALAILGLILVVVVIFMVRSVATRLIAVVVLGAAVFGLLHYRQQLTDCDKHGCACTLFAEELKGGGCTSSG